MTAIAKSTRRIPDRALIVTLLTALAAWALPVLVQLHERWLAAGFEHGYPVALMTLFLLYSEYRKRPVDTIAPSSLGLLPLTAALLGITVAQAVNVNIVVHVAFPVALLAALWSATGWQTARRFVAPLAFIYFAIPFWQIAAYLPVNAPSLNEGLRALTTSVVSSAVSLTGLPAFIQGNYIQIPHGTFEIAEGCSGRAYFIVAVELGLFYGLAWLRRWANRLKLLAVVVAAALVANWIRVYALIVIGYLTEMQHALIQSHSTFGWFIFMFVIAPMIVVAGRLESREQADASDGREPAPPPRRAPAVLGTGIAVVAAAAACQFLLLTMQSATPPKTRIVAPELPGWTLQGSWRGVTRPEYPGAPATGAFRYTDDSGEVRVFLAHYPIQHERSEAVYFANRPAGPESRLLTAELPDGMNAGEFEVARTADDGGSERMLWVGLRIAGRPARGGIDAKVQQLAGLLQGRTDAQVVVLSAMCGDDCQDAARRLDRFASAQERLFDAAAASRLESPEN